MDVHDPASPKEVGKLVDDDNFVSFGVRGGEWGGRLTVANGYAYILTGEDSSDIGPSSTLELFHIVDVRDPANPVYKKAYADPTGVEYLFQDTDAFLTDLTAYDNDNLLLISAYDGFPIFDIRDLLNPRFLVDVAADAGVASPFGYFQAAGWSLGRVVGNRVYSPNIQGLNIIQIGAIAE